MQTDNIGYAFHTKTIFGIFRIFMNKIRSSISTKLVKKSPEATFRGLWELKIDGIAERVQFTNH